VNNTVQNYPNPLLACITQTVAYIYLTAAYRNHTCTTINFQFGIFTLTAVQNNKVSTKNLAKITSVLIL